MSPRYDPLERGILELFKAACADGRLNVAEHLLRALEVNDTDETTLQNAAGRTALAEAYREIAGRSR